MGKSNTGYQYCWLLNYPKIEQKADITFTFKNDPWLIFFAAKRVTVQTPLSFCPMRLIIRSWRSAANAAGEPVEPWNGLTIKAIGFSHSSFDKLRMNGKSLLRWVSERLFLFLH